MISKAYPEMRPQRNNVPSNQVDKNNRDLTERRTLLPHGRYLKTCQE